jgi:type IV secretory pathway TraG/TraD family ATPase VirD4
MKTHSEINPPIDPIVKYAVKFAETHTTSLALLAVAGAYFAYDAIKGPAPIKGSAEWATAGQLNRARFLCKLQNIQKKPGKLSYILGNIPVYGAQTSMLTFGKPETGKSYGIANHAIYKHLKDKQPAVIMDLQYPEQTRHFIPLALKFGFLSENIKLFVPGEDTSDVWNPTQAATGSKALETGKSINANTKPVGAKMDGFFDPACESLLAGLLSYVRHVKGLNSILGCRAIARLPNLVKRISDNMNQIIATAGADAMHFDQFLTNLESVKTASNVTATVMNAIAGGSSEDIYPCMDGESNIPLVMDGQQLLIIGCTQQYRESVAPYLVALLEQVIVANTFHGRKTNLQINIDELAAVNVAKLKFYINENRKYGVFFNLATQAISQLQERYGKEGASSIMTAVGFKAFFNPGENDTAKYLQDTLGTHKYREKERSHGYSGGRSSSNTSNPVRERPLFSLAEALKLPQGTAIFLTRGASSKTQEYIPFKRKVVPSAEYIRDMDDAAREWKEHTEAALKRRSPVRPPSTEEIFETFKLAEELFPLGASSDEKLVESIIQKNNSTYKEMLNDL